MNEALDSDLVNKSVGAALLARKSPATLPHTPIGRAGQIVFSPVSHVERNDSTYSFSSVNNSKTPTSAKTSFASPSVVDKRASDQRWTDWSEEDAAPDLHLQQRSSRDVKTVLRENSGRSNDNRSSNKKNSSEQHSTDNPTDLQRNSNETENNNIMINNKNSNDQDLIAELEILRMQNQMLTNRIQRAHQDAQEQLELERQQRTLAENQLAGLLDKQETINEQLKSIQEEAQKKAQQQAQEQVLREKEAFLQNMKALQQERDALMERVQRSEEIAEKEAQLVRLQKAELDEKALQLEQERKAITERIAANERAMTNEEKNSDDIVEDNATATKNTELQQERDQLVISLKGLTEKQIALDTAMREQQEFAALNAQQLEAQLAAEREHMELRVETMTKQQQQLAEKLAASERAAKEEAEALTRRLEEEKNQAIESLQKLEKEKEDLIKSIQNQHNKSNEESIETTGIQEDNSEANVPQGEQESSELNIKLEKMREEMAQLREELKRKEEEGLQREQALQEQNLKEKEELKKTVQRMRRDLNLKKDQKKQQKQKLRQQLQQKRQRSGGIAALVNSGGATTPVVAGTGASAAMVLSNNDSKTFSEESSQSPHDPNQELQKSRAGGPLLLTKRSLFDILEDSNMNSCGEGMYSIVSANDSASGSRSNLGSQLNLLTPASLAPAPVHSSSSNNDGNSLRYNEGSQSGSNNLTRLGRPSSLYKIHLTRRSNPNCFQLLPQMSKIIEEVGAESGKTRKTIMDLDSSSDEEDDGRSKKKKLTKQLTPTANSKLSFESTSPEGALVEDEVVGLPAPHCAAALGDLERLRNFAETTDLLLRSLDAVGRQPLFYSCAYGQVEATKFLLSVLVPQRGGTPTAVAGWAWIAGDMHGDTPLHAAASSGNAECIDLLLDAAFSVPSDVAAGGRYYAEHGSDAAAAGTVALGTGGKIATIMPTADPRNNMQMTPAHLAASEACLDVLYRYRADITAVDCHERTPLFIACAMNREECAEYLVGCLDLTGNTEDSILKKDFRGDTPLHAAACNGSVECLLLLLQYGIDPRPTNNLGLKAVDLAVRNRQQKCRDVLAEYHLHYCTSSEFDSVLFLATLEGHRRIKEYTHSDSTATKSPESNPSSNPFELTPSPSKEKSKNDASPLLALEETKKVLHHATQSMFRLRTNHSLRLQRYGQWIAYHDKMSQTVFWYNHQTMQGQWEQPQEVALSDQGNKDVFDKTLNAKMSMRLKHVEVSGVESGTWIAYLTESGRTFYYNKSNGAFQWVHPDTESPIKNIHPQIESSNGNQIGNINSTQFQPDASPQQYEQNQDNNSDWQPYLDPDSGGVFWYNHRTCVSQWECPEEFNQQTDNNNYSKEGRRLSFDHSVVSEMGNHADVGNESIFAVEDHENDLGI